MNMANTQQTGCLTPQSQLRRRYNIVELVGEGGMGSVYKAIDTQANNRLVAIKEMGLGYYRPRGRLREGQELFRREARILSKLAHPNLPRVYAFFNENERFYLVMDFIEGKTLQQLQAESATRCLPVEDVLRCALQLCGVLSYLHQQTPPIIFRDLKPSNVMVTAKGRAYLIDFGIARVFKRGLQSDTQHLGTPGFASPEQHGDGQTGPRSDLYSLGATLYCCLTGKDPRTNKPTLFHFLPAHDLNPQIPLRLSELIQSLVAANEDRRPLDAETVQNALLNVRGYTGNSDIKDNGSHDVAKAFTDPLGSWVSYTRPLGLLASWLIGTIAHLLVRVCGTLYGWLLLAILLRLKQLCVNGKGVMSIWLTDLWQSFYSEEVRWLIRDVWTPYFTFLFVLFAVAMTSGSLYMLAILHYPVHFVALCLCLLLLLLLGWAYINQRIHHPLAYSILMAVTLFLVLTTMMLFTLPEVQSTMWTITFNQLLTIGILVLAMVSLLRPTQCLAWVDHLCLAVVAAIYALLLSGRGAQALGQFLSIPMNNAVLINVVLICLSCSVALIEVARCKYRFTWSDRLWGDRLHLFIVALIATTMQLVYGLEEITHLPLFMSQTQKTMEESFNLVSLSVLLAGVPVIAVLPRLFMAPGSSRMIRLSLLLLALYCAVLQNFLGPVVQFPLLKSPLYPLTTSLASIMHINQLVACGLALIACILVCRWQHPFGGFDQFSLLCVATVCAILQNAAWNIDGALQSPQGAAIQQSQLYMIVINKSLAQGFMLIVLIVQAIAISSVFLHLASQFAWIDRKITRVMQHFTWLGQLTLRLHHLILLATTVTSAFLLWLRNSGTLQPNFTLFNQLVIASLLICSGVALMRLSRPFTNIDRWLILMDIIACTLLLFSGYTQRIITQGRSEITSVEPWLADPHIMLPPQSIGLGLLFAVLVCLMWVRRGIPQVYRNMLKIGFGLALSCAVLQWFIPVFLLAGLIMLILSVLLAVKMEQA